MWDPECIEVVRTRADPVFKVRKSGKFNERTRLVTSVGAGQWWFPSHEASVNQ